MTTYFGMVDRVISLLSTGKRICMVSYGHPGVFAFPMHESIRRARALGFEATMLPAISTED
jgi:precorrin-3B methylase